MPETKLNYLTPTRRRHCGMGLCSLSECPFHNVESLQRQMFADIAREQISEGKAEVDAAAERFVSYVNRFVPELREVRTIWQGIRIKHKAPGIEFRARCHRKGLKKGVETTCLGAAQIVTVWERIK